MVSKSTVAPIIPIYVYSGLEILLSVSLFTLTRAPLHISIPDVAAYADLAIGLALVLFILMVRLPSLGSSEPSSGFICKEKFLERHEADMEHTAVGDDARDGAENESHEPNNDLQSEDDTHEESGQTTDNKNKKTVSYADVDTDNDSLALRRKDLPVWPSLTPDPHGRRRKHKKIRSAWNPGFENETHGYIRERRTSGIVQVELEPSSVPPPWELGNASARSRLR
ncbi:hypothetical protein BDV59DRAFT_201286 [Aspergillus ambiguus]|uniref:uncharacterized protein n=1 Tax=Aspergillus ambiguus TaxID=176160 RepID=UPI003CCDA5EC